MLTLLLIEGSRSKSSLAPVFERRKYKVVRALTYKEAIAQATDHSPALIILNTASSRIDGARMCRNIRAAVDGIAILLLVRKSAQVDSTCGADFILRQPFTTRRLLNRVARMMPSGQGDVLRLGDLSLNVATRCVRLGKKERQLTPKQSRLLEAFMRQPGDVITRRQLMKAVWKTDYIGDTRTIDVHIRWLREMIEVDAGRPRRLITVRGIGYALKM